MGVEATGCDRSQGLSPITGFGDQEAVTADGATKGDRAQSPSIRDVARAAGVSHQTVSRVINGSPNVSSATREVVLASIDSLGFRPNRAARALAGGPTQSVTVLASNTSRYGFAAALEGIEEATREVGFQMGFRSVETRDLLEVRQIVEDAIEPAGAMIVIAFDRAGVIALESVPPAVPTVALIQAPDPTYALSRPSVWIDEFQAAREATQYLLSLGHRTVHHLPVPSWPDTTPRELGWREGLRQAGIHPEEPEDAGFTADWGYESGSRLAKRRDVTAVLCGNDEIALGLMAATRAVGRDVPADLSVIGFDDIPHAKFFTPSLTTVRQDFKALGRVGFIRLLDVSRSGVRTAPPAMPEARLVIRGSTGPAPRPEGTHGRSPPVLAGDQTS